VLFLPLLLGVNSGHQFGVKVFYAISFLEHGDDCSPSRTKNKRANALR